MRSTASWHLVHAKSVCNVAPVAILAMGVYYRSRSTRPPRISFLLTSHKDILSFSPQLSTQKMFARITTTTIARHCSRRRAPQLLLPTRRGFAKGSPTSVALEETCLQDPNSMYGVQATSGRHTLHSDLMPEAGGQDIGPSPKEYAMVALGSCTLMTMRIYANAMIDGGIRVHVEMESNLDDEQKQKLLTAAEKCPVKRIFGGGMKEGITTVWAGGKVEKIAQ